MHEEPTRLALRLEDLVRERERLNFLNRRQGIDVSGNRLR